MASSWVDGFLLWDAIIIASLVFADWLLGNEQRKALKDKVGYWWLYLEEMSFSGLVAKDAGRVSRTFKRIFGARWWGVRRIGLASLVSLIISFVFIMVEVPKLVCETMENSGFHLAEPSMIPYLTTGPLFRTSSVPNAIVGWASLSITIWLLTMMARSVSPIRLGFLMITDIVIAALLVYVCYIVTIGLHLTQIDPNFPELQGLQMQLIHESVFPITVIASLPTLIHLLVVIVFLGSKLFRPLLVKPVSLIMLRLYESPKGVLSQLAVGLGAVAKLLQQGMKYLMAG